MPWNNHCHRGTANPQSRDFEENLQAYFSSSCTHSSSLVAQCVNHWNRCVQKGIHSGGNWNTIRYTSWRWFSRLRKIRQRDGLQDKMWMIKPLTSPKVSSGIWNASHQWQWSYLILFIRSISVYWSIWWTG
jgi:hypothetical protein